MKGNAGSSYEITLVSGSLTPIRMDPAAVDQERKYEIYHQPRHAPERPEAVTFLRG